MSLLLGVSVERESRPHTTAVFTLVEPIPRAKAMSSVAQPEAGRLTVSDGKWRWRKVSPNKIRGPLAK